jgi:TolB-like protein
MGDAIANEINTQLTKIKEFHIFSYTSSSQYKGPNKPTIPQIGKELGANFIVKGTVERQLEGYFHNQSRYSS